MFEKIFEGLKEDRKKVKTEEDLIAYEAVVLAKVINEIKIDVEFIDKLIILSVVFADDPLDARRFVKRIIKAYELKKEVPDLHKLFQELYGD